MKKIAEIDDVYATKLTDGRYGAVQVLNRIDKSYLLFVTTYIDDSIPDISDPRLNEILIQNRGAFRKEKALIWKNGHPSKVLIFVGNIIEALRADIKEHNTYGSKWDTTCAEPVLCKKRRFGN